VPPFFLTFLAGGGGDPYPSPTALIKARIDLEWVFLITSGFSLPEPGETYRRMLCGQK